ncbi:MAG: MBL fold metallo-hydrolase [Candidatus Cloacimonetes bacterium]|nr:MBL fold metallo-hydrolase [Candidatus Cloacimonadota bacterium]
MLFWESFPVGALQCNCTILGCEEKKEAVIIDPGDDKDKILKKVRSKGYTVKYLLHTHAHFDHIGMAGPLKREGHGKILLHQEDVFLYDAIEEQAGWFGLEVPMGEPVDHFLIQGDEIQFGNQVLQVLHTPGHTPGSCSFCVPSANLLLTGDTLFKQSIGRTDLPGGDNRQLLHSIKSRILSLKTDYHIVPGHGAHTTLSGEARSNPFLKSI